jgi:hypothetical protein
MTAEMTAGGVGGSSTSSNAEMLYSPVHDAGCAVLELGLWELDTLTHSC